MTAPLDADVLTHTPCCSSHGIDMTCEKYRRTHFVEVRPCCPVDAERLKPRVHLALNGTLTCSVCGTRLTVLATAYGGRASCGCADIRWTCIRPHDGGLPEWVAERR